MSTSRLDMVLLRLGVITIGYGATPIGSRISSDNNKDMNRFGGLNGAMIGCMSMDTTCNEPSKHLWWDLLNPTQAVNSILADAAWSGSPMSNLCNPITILELVSIKV
ncbi:hypothetical protein PIB30_061716 [Stylosanthes scabra]|uniref:Uncharacterized protein n=1 Tax=Stylosanthes scabra TaxID=79078 RepID=A0ABU6VK58_9FABA|nr:hypothetical protein [Stylosanthes scabra]